MVEEEEEATKQEEVGLNLHKDTFNNPFNQGVICLRYKFWQGQSKEK